VNFQSFSDPQIFNTLRDEWTPLLHRSSADGIFLTDEWQQTWWTAYHPGALWIITCRTDDDELIAIAPWFIEDHPTRGRVVRTVGCVEVTDYLDIIVARGYESTFFPALADYLAAHLHSYDVLDLCNIPAASVTLACLPDQLRACGFDVTVKLQEVCPVIELPATWDDYLARLDKKQRHELRRKIRRAQGAPEGVAWYTVGPEHNLETELERFLRLMASSAEEKAVFLRDPQNLTFFRTVAPVLMERGWLQLNILTVGGNPAAAYLNFSYNNQVLVYNSGQDGQYAHLSPGIVLLAYTIRHAIEHGQRVFDFLRGNENYKYQMGGRDTEVFMLIARHP
jgi:CelD/BcsL family acetyltransferase involved in cellulose biosynthesis